MKDPLELFKDIYPDTNPSNEYPLSTSRGGYTVISYYGNEIGFFIKSRTTKDEPVIIITQEDTKWIEDVLEEDYGVEKITENIEELTFENILRRNYGLSLNFNKFRCVRGNEDVHLIKSYFSKIVDFIKRSRMLGELSQGDLKFDARNSGQIVLQQILERSLSTKGEFYEFILNESDKLQQIFAYSSLKRIFIEKLDRLGFKEDSVLRNLLSNDIELARKEIELLVYFSIYEHLAQFERSPITSKLSKYLVFINLLRYKALFDTPGLKEEIGQIALHISSDELFSFRGIETYIQYIELKQFIESNEVPTIADYGEAVGIFQFEWDQLVRESKTLEANFLKIKSTFKHDLFKEHLEILEMWHQLREFNQNRINDLVPDWKKIYEYIIPYEKVYQNLKQADVQNRVLAPEYKAEVCANYEAIIKEIHERYYPYLLEQLRFPENLVSDALRQLKSGTKNGILLVFDGMRLDFWKILREQIGKARLPIEIEEEIRYAVVPTLTEVSRHSIFANRIAYNIREEHEFEGTYIFSEADFYEKYNPNDRLTGIVSHFIDNRIHISNSVKGEFVEFRGIREDFRRYVDSVIIPMLRHILSSRTVQVIITSDHGFINLDKKNRILDHVYEETIKDSIKRLNSDWDFNTYSDMFLVSPSEKVTTEISNRFSNDIIIIKETDYGRYNVPKELGGDAIIFPKVYRHLWDASLKYNHGSLSMFETMVPFIRLTYKYE